MLDTFGCRGIIDLRGTVLAQVPDGEGHAMVTLDLDPQGSIQRNFPALEHHRIG